MVAKSACRAALSNPANPQPQPQLASLPKSWVSAFNCDFVGRLQDCYVFASDFLVTPWLASTNEPPIWSPQADEVARVLEMPLEALLDPQSVGSIDIQRGPRSFRALRCFQLGEDQNLGCNRRSSSTSWADLFVIRRKSNAVQFDSR